MSMDATLSAEVASAEEDVNLVQFEFARIARDMFRLRCVAMVARHTRLGGGHWSQIRRDVNDLTDARLDALDGDGQWMRDRRDALLNAAECMCNGNVTTAVYRLARMEGDTPTDWREVVRNRMRDTIEE